MKQNQVEIGGTYVAKVSGTLARVTIERENPHGGWDARNVDTKRSIRIKSGQRLRRRVTAAAATAERNRDACDDQNDRDACATIGCDQPAALTYLGRPRCQECYEDECEPAAVDGGGTTETNHEEDHEMATRTKKSKGPQTAKTSKPAKATKPATATATKLAKAAKPAGATGPADATKPATKAAKATRPAKPKATTADKPKRISALDAAATVLEASGQAMRAGEMIAAMAEQGLWSSPNGKTPHATLYAAILREINVKGREARFRKSERGKFEYAGGGR